MGRPSRGLLEQVVRRRRGSATAVGVHLAVRLRYAPILMPFIPVRIPPVSERRVPGSPTSPDFEADRAAPGTAGHRAPPVLMMFTMEPPLPRATMSAIAACMRKKGPRRLTATCSSKSWAWCRGAGPAGRRGRRSSPGRRPAEPGDRLGDRGSALTDVTASAWTYRTVCPTGRRGRRRTARRRPCGDRSPRHRRRYVRTRPPPPHPSPAFPADQDHLVVEQGVAELRHESLHRGSDRHAPGDSPPVGCDRPHRHRRHRYAPRTGLECLKNASVDDLGRDVRRPGRPRSASSSPSGRRFKSCPRYHESPGQRPDT